MKIAGLKDKGPKIFTLRVLGFKMFGVDNFEVQVLNVEDCGFVELLKVKILTLKKSGLKIKDCRAGDLRIQEFNVKRLSG